MKQMVFNKQALVTGCGSIDYLSTVSYQKAVLITGGSSMQKTGVLDKIREIMKGTEESVVFYQGVGKNPTTAEVNKGLEFLKGEKPDVVIAVGGGSAIDAAKIMVLFYDHPELNFDNVFSEPLEDKGLHTKFIAIPSTSGTASEVTHVSVITFEEQEYKLAIRTENIRPQIAILDGYLPATLPANVAAETGMDALTHALEAYINKNGNDFTDALAKEAIEGLMEYLPASVVQQDKTAREKCHNYQCMAGMAFSNSGLGMVHGVSHAFGGKYNLAHGLANAIILPYSMDYNKKDPEVRQKYDKLSHILGEDIIEAVVKLKEKLGIPASIAEAGISEETFRTDFEFLLKNSMKGSTVVNPIKVSEEDMRCFLDCVYYGKKVNF